MNPLVAPVRSLILIAPLAVAVAQDDGASLETGYASAPGDTPQQRRDRFSRTRARFAGIENQFQPGRFSEDGHAVPYRLFRPADYSSDRSYPLVVFFHGGGARGTDNRRQIFDAHFSARIWGLPEYQAKHPCFILAPQLTSSISPMIWQVRGRRVQPDTPVDSASGPAGEWNLSFQARHRGDRHFKLVVERSGGRWSARIRGPGRNRFQVSQSDFADGQLRVFFGNAGSERNNRMELRLDENELRGVLHRDLDARSSARRIAALIDSVCSEFNIDKNRVYATGLSMGGAVTWSIVGSHPSRFAAAVPICGPCDPSNARQIVEHGVAIWAFHGTDDTGVRVESSRAMVAALRQAGGRPRYTEFPDVGHDAWIDAYQDPELHAWLFRQRRDD